jgi:hypothetical protein
MGPSAGDMAVDDLLIADCLFQDYEGC